MSGLLHIDSSPRPESISRAIAAVFVESWRASHPDEPYRYRDLAAEPIAPIDAATLDLAGAVSACADIADIDGLPLTVDQRAAWSVTKPLVAELLDADTVLLAVPMHNFSIPAALKVWIDRIVFPPLLPNEQRPAPLATTRFVVTTARGGAYGPATPRADFDFQEPYLRAAFGQLGIADNLTFVHTEMTLADVVPALAQFKDLADQSREHAERQARQLAVAS